MPYLYYCPYCGMEQDKNNVECVFCQRNMITVRSEHRSDYYAKKSIDIYGKLCSLKVLKEEEAFKNPLYAENKK